MKNNILTWLLTGFISCVIFQSSSFSQDFKKNKLDPTSFAFRFYNAPHLQKSFSVIPKNEPPFLSALRASRSQYASLNEALKNFPEEEQMSAITLMTSWYKPIPVPSDPNIWAKQASQSLKKGYSLDQLQSSLKEFDLHAWVGVTGNLTRIHFLNHDGSYVKFK